MNFILVYPKTNSQINDKETVKDTLLENEC